MAGPHITTAEEAPLGYAANRKAIDLAIQWAFERKIIPRRFSVDELFDETTAALNV
jgi:4,5-dihydroxyphthalate decarboxylase